MNRLKCEVQHGKEQMTVDELISEYEKIMRINLCFREREIFRYAYTIGVNGWNSKEEEE